MHRPEPSSVQYHIQLISKVFELDSQDIRSFLNVSEPIPAVEQSATTRAIAFLNYIIQVPVSSANIHPSLSMYDLKRHLCVRT